MQSRNVHVLYLESCWHDSQCEGILQSINLEVLLHISASLLTRSKARGHIVKGHACLILKIFVIDLDKSWKIKTWVFYSWLLKVHILCHTKCFIVWSLHSQEWGSSSLGHLLGSSMIMGKQWRLPTSWPLPWLWIFTCLAFFQFLYITLSNYWLFTSYFSYSYFD